MTERTQLANGSVTTARRRSSQSVRHDIDVVSGRPRVMRSTLVATNVTFSSNQRPTRTDSPDQLRHPWRNTIRCWADCRRNDGIGQRSRASRFEAEQDATAQY